VKRRLNFSSRPFGGVERGLPLLWALNALLLAALIFTAWRWQELRSRNSDAHAALDRVRGQQRSVAAEHEAILTRLEGVDVRSYRIDLLRYHAIQTALATEWGKLLDELGELLPEDVRLVRVRPGQTRLDDPGAANTIELDAESRTKEAQLAFVGALQARPGFEQVAFLDESYDQTGVAVAFSLSFRFQPDLARARDASGGGAP
jgi:Tfp pilus assembly protein PilN